MNALNLQQALDLLKSDDLIGLGAQADILRKKLHPEGFVTYSDSDRNAQVCRTTSEIVQMSHSAGKSLSDTLARLREDGLEFLSDFDCADLHHDPAQWAELHRAAHHLGIGSCTVASCEDSDSSGVNYLEAIRQIQLDTGGFIALMPLFHSGRSTAVDYLKFLAISRLYLPNIANIQASPAALGLKLSQVSLRFGANDLENGESPSIAESRVQNLSEEQIRWIIRGAGFIPKQRDATFRVYAIN